MPAVGEVVNLGLSNGDVYKGEMRDGRPNGRGAVAVISWPILDNSQPNSCAALLAARCVHMGGRIDVQRGVVRRLEAGARELRVRERRHVRGRLPPGREARLRFRVLVQRLAVRRPMACWTRARAGAIHDERRAVLHGDLQPGECACACVKNRQTFHSVTLMHMRTCCREPR